MAQRKPLKVVAGTYSVDGYATSTPSGFKELDPTDTFNAAHIEQDATHRFVTDAEKTTWDAHVTAPHAPANAQKNSDITKAEIEAKLTGEISSHTHAGGGSETDPVAMAALTTHTSSHAPANATANDTDANLKNRANHTGTQPASTISDFSTAADARIAAASVNALADVTVTTPAVGQVLKWNGTAWVNDTDATGGGAIVNKSVAAQSPFATDTYLTGSMLAFPSAPVVGTIYTLLFDVTKTAAGTATPIITIRLGTAGTIADTARLTFTFGAGTAAADTGVFEVRAMFRVVGASAVLQAWARLTSNLTTTGLSNVVKARVATSAAFDSTVANLKIGASYNGGASASHTIQLARAELII